MKIASAMATEISSPHLSGRSLILAASAAVSITIVTLSIVPFGHLACPVFPPFVLMYAAMMSVISALTAYFFAIQFRYRRKPRLGALAGGFGYVSVLVFSQILVFPGVLPAKTILLGGPQSAVWMWAFWHSGFPLFILAGQLLSTGESPDGASGPSQNLGLALIPGGPMIANFLVYLCITQGDTLPSLVSGMSLEGLRHSVFVPITIVATILALVTCVWTTRLRDLLSLWLAIALLASLADSILTLAATNRYDLGWYSGRILSIVALSIVFCVLIHEMSRLYDALANAHAELA